MMQQAGSGIDARKLFSGILALLIVSVGFSTLASDGAEAAFIVPLSNNGMSPTFVAEDTVWNDAGTIAVVVGYDTNPLLPNSYVYYYVNDTYVPLNTGGHNDQRLFSVDYYREAVYGWDDGTRAPSEDISLSANETPPNMDMDTTPGDEILRRTILFQDFSSATFPPTGWSVQQSGIAGTWTRSTTNAAGGTSPEAMFTYGSPGQGTSRLYAGPIDTTGMAYFKLQWRQRIDDYLAGVGVKLLIQTSADLSVWNDAGWHWDDTQMPQSIVASQKTMDITTADVGSSTFYIAWTVTGNSYQMNNWYIDDVQLSGSWFDDMEKGDGAWQPTDNGMGTLWQRGNPSGFGPGAPYSGTNCWGTNLVSSYTNNAIAYLTMPSLDTRGLTQISLSFWMWFVSENGRDVGWVEASADGAVWNPVNPTSGPPYQANMYGIQGYTGIIGGWTQARFDLSAYAGGTMWMRFRFRTDGLTVNPGWYIDDVMLSSNYAVGLVPEFQNKYGLPSQTIDHLLTVTNQGLNDDTYDLSKAGNVWPTALLAESGAAMNVGPFASNYSNLGQTRGYWFTAPCDFTITALRVPTDVGLTTQNVQVVRLNVAPPTTSYTSLGYWNTLTGTGWNSCSINVQNGDIIGVLGARGTTTMFNSYGNVAPYATNINGINIQLNRLMLQKNLNNAAALPGTDSLDTNIAAFARIEMEYTINSIPLAAGQSKNFLARVSIPAGASPNNADMATITTTSRGLPSVSANAQVRTKVPGGILSTTPTNGATGVAVTQSVIVTFGEPMNTATVTYSCTPNPGGWVASWNTPTNTVLTLTHTAFAYSTGYTFQITGGTNIYGISLGASVAANPWSFTTLAAAAATATGPISATPTNVGSITLTYTWTGATPTSVNLYYTTTGGTSWTLAGNDATVDGSFAWTVPSSGTYGWIAQAVGGGSTELSPPTAGTVPEATPYVYDNVRPTVGWQYPANGGTNIPINQPVSIRFSETMNTGSLTFTCSPDPGGWSPSWVTGVVFNDRVNLGHTNFNYGTTYTITITALTDLAGNNLNPMPYSYSFTTVAAGSATATGPTGTSNVAGVTLTYSYAGAPTSVNLYYTTNGGTSWSFAGNDATVDGSYAWTCPSSGTYGWIAQAVGGGSTELSPPTAGTAPEAASYIYDTQSPTLFYRYPVIDGTGIAINQNVRLIFTESMNTGSLTFTCSPDPGGWSQAWSTWTYTNDQVYLSHTAFAYGTTYTFTITGASDIAGNALAVPISWSFTTIAAASATATGPISATPTNVGSVTLTYSYTGVPTSVNLYYTTNGGTSWTLAGNDATVDGSFAWTVPSSGTYGWIAQAVGGGTTELSPPTAGTAPEISSYIFDNASPTITATTPVNNAVSVSLTQSIIITFSEPMNTGSVTYTCAPNPGGWVASWNGPTNTVLTLTHTAFQYYTVYTFTVTAATDVAGNALVASAIPNPWSFRTIGATATATGPIGGPTNVVAVTLTYSFTDTPTSVNIYYTKSTVSPWTWVLAGNDATVDGSYAYTITAGSGSYRWYASAVGGNSIEPSPPSNLMDPETIAYVLDLNNPAPPTGLTVNWVNTLISQDFTSGVPPAGWAIQTSGTTGAWSQSATIVAGGTSPEALFTYGLNGIGISRLYAGPFDTTGLSSLDLQWRNMINDYAGGTGVQCRVQTSSDTVTWQDAGYLWDDTVTPGSQAASIQEIAVATSDVGSSTFYISWTITGNSYQLNYWYIDDVKLSYAGAGFTNDNKLEWVKSTDDGAGTNDVHHYNIYRANAAAGPWNAGALIATVSAGTASYFDLGRGEPDGINWWYVVRAVDTAGNEEMNTNAAPEDPTPPTIISTIPVSGATGVAINQNIVVIFSEEMNPASLAYTCSPNPGGWSAVWSQVTFPNDRAILSHTNFLYGTTYTFTVTAAEDLAGNPLAAGAVPNPWSFTTQAAATATATGPTGGPTNVAAVTITYSRTGSPTSINIYYTLDGGTTWNFAGTDWSVDGTFAWSCPTGGTYGWIAQAVGGGSTESSPPAPGTPPESSSYVYDNVRPTVSSTVPANSATNVAITQNIVITFSEPIVTGSFVLGTSFTISPNPGGLSVGWSGGNTIATVTHTAFAYNTLYTCTITTAVRDPAGNFMLNNYVWSFTTIAAASATATGPTSAAFTNVAGITISYTYTGAPTSVNIYYTTTGGTSWSFWGNDATVDGSYGITLSTSGTYGWIAQAVGGGTTEPSPPAPGTPPEAASYLFDNVRPTISSVVPANAAINVAVGQNIIITFSEAVNTATFVLGTSFTISPNPGGLSVAWSGGNTIATVSHNPFAYGTTYTCTVTTSVSDIASNTLLANYGWSFTTIAGATATATGPTGGPTNVATVTLTYTWTGTPTSVNLYFTTDGGANWNLAGNDASVDGSFPWVIPYSWGTFAWYASAVGGGSTEPSPPAPGTTSEAGSYVYDSVSPAIISTNPMDATTGVPVSQSIVITFSESMSTGSFTYTCSPDPGGWSLVWSSVSYANDRVTLSHTAFLYVTTYTFTVTAVNDAAGNSLSAGAVPNPWSFTTSSGATATATGPTGGPTTVGAILITYTWTGTPTSVNVYYSTNGGNIWTFANNDPTVEGSFGFTMAVSGYYYWYVSAVGGGSTEPSPPPPGTSPEAGPYIFDVDPPYVTAVSPGVDAINVLGNAPIIVDFSEQMNIASGVIIINPNPGGIATSWSNGDLRLTINHDSFEEGITVTVEVLLFEDIAGNTMAFSYIWSFTISEMVIVGYRDVFWMCGDKIGSPLATVYKFLPQTSMNLIPMNDAGIYPAFYTIAVDNLGNALCAGSGLQYMYYYDGTAWIPIPDDADMLNGFGFESMAFNPNDGRFYIGSYFNIFYTDAIPLSMGSNCYMFNNYFGNGDDITSIAWNELYDYGLVAEGPEIIKIWPFGYYGDGSLRYASVRGSGSGDWYKDISWDSDGWNEAGIVGSKGANRAYWRYYHSNPQIIPGHEILGGVYTTCAMKPPASPKWLFVPYSGGSIKVQITEKDESDLVILNVVKPHIFDMDMWKQSDPMRSSVLGNTVDANTTYTFFIEGNYSKGGMDSWDAMNLQLVVAGWYDNAQIGINSVPGDPTWSTDDHRTRQFRLTYSPGNVPAMQYPFGSPGEFSIHSYHVSAGHGPDGSHRRVYMNVTIGPQAAFSFGNLAQATVSPYHPNTALNDLNTWDLNVTLRDAIDLSVRNSTYGEFGMKKNAKISSWGTPSGNIPPGSVSTILDSPSYIMYSINAPYTLNVSIPNLYRESNPAFNFIPSGHVEAQNSHPNSDSANSDMDSWAAFNVPNADMCIWGQRVLGTWTVPAPENGNFAAGPYYTDFLYPAFQTTWVEWAVTVDAGTPEGIYRGTITITLWS